MGTLVLAGVTLVGMVSLTGWRQFVFAVCMIGTAVALYI